MRLRDHYDWVVLGNDPGALLSASLVARLGLSVLVLPLGSHAPLVVSKSGQFLDPESNYLIGLGQGAKVDGLVLECLNQLETIPSEKEGLEYSPAVPQVLTPQSRLVLASQDQVAAEFQREFGKVLTKQIGLLPALKQTEAEYQAFWHRLPKRLTLSTAKKPHSTESMTLKALHHQLKKDIGSGDAASVWLSLRKKLSELEVLRDNPALIEVCTGLWFEMTSSTDADPTLFELLHIFSLSRTAGAFRGGMTAYRKYLLEVARRIGVHIPVKTDCRRLFVERGRFVGVQVTNRGSMISVHGGILGCSLNQALNRMVFTGRHWFRGKKTPVKPQGWKFTLALTVHQEAIPARLLPRAVWQEEGAPPLEIEVVSPADYGLTEADHQIIYIRTVMPYTLESLKVEYQQLIGARMMRQLTEIIPFLEFHVIQVYPDFRVMKTANAPFGDGSKEAAAQGDEALKEWELVYGFSTLDQIPDNLLLYGKEGVGASSGMEGLFIASNEAYPQLGSLGPTVAALESVAWIAHRSGLAGPLS